MKGDKMNCWEGTRMNCWEGILSKKYKNMMGTCINYKLEYTDIENIKKEINALDFSHKFTPRPKKIIYNESKGVTVVLWEDGTKTIVKCSENNQRDLYNAYCAAFAKKCYGTNSALKREIDKLTVYHGDKNKETV